MAQAPAIVVADAEFLASLPDLIAGSPEAVAVASLAAAGRLVTTREAKAVAEDSYQAVVNFPAFQAIKVLEADGKRRAQARALASSMPPKALTRHNNFCDLEVAAAAIKISAHIATTIHRQPFYGAFKPPLAIAVCVDQLVGF